MMRSLTLSGALLIAACGSDGSPAGPRLDFPHLAGDGDDDSEVVDPEDQAAFEDNLEQRLEGVCDLGEQRACKCPKGKAGFEVCLKPSKGEFSACSCEAPEGALKAQPDAPPPVTQCGTTKCAPYLEEDTDVGAKSCCTKEGACGSKSGESPRAYLVPESERGFFLGPACLKRGGDPGTASADCPDESGTWIDLMGCCRSDGYCGLSIDNVTNFDVGCIERTAMQKLVNDGSAERDATSIVFLLPVTPVNFPALRCKSTP